MPEFETASTPGKRRELADGRHAFDVDLDAHWVVGGKPHGGYLLALLTRAATKVTGSMHPHPTSVSGSFIASPEPGPAEIVVETLRAGRAVTQLRASLRQAESVRVEALLALGTLTDSAAWWSDLEPVAIADEQDCVRLPAEPPGGGFEVPLMEVIEHRMDPAELGFALGKPRMLGTFSSWQRLVGGLDWDPISLLVAVDPVPPVSYDLGMPGWAPTIALSAYLRRLPAPGPVRVRMRATDVGDDRMDEVAHVWDSKGRLVAQATQLAAVRRPN